MAPPETAQAGSNLLTGSIESATALTKKFGIYLLAIASTMTSRHCRRH
jgi:hypothetical protein